MYAKKEKPKSFIEVRREKIEEELVGKLLSDARRDYTQGPIRVVRENRVPYTPNVNDYNVDRVNVAVEDNRIVKVEGLY